MPDMSLLGQYTEARLDTYTHWPSSPDVWDKLYDMCAAGIAQEERAPGSTGVNSRWWACELLSWLHTWAGDAMPPITPKWVR